MYPLVIYKGTPDLHESITVTTEEEHRLFADEGWITAGELWKHPGAAPAFADLKKAEKPKSEAKKEDKAKV